MKKRGHVGIDESNHGRFPEIHVGVFSPYEKDIVERKLTKIRGKKKNLSNFLGGEREYCHILIPDSSIKDIYGTDGIKVISLAEIINYYSKKGYSFDIIRDGMLKERDITNLERILYPLKMPKLNALDYADETFHLVNKADAIANKLVRYYGNLRKNQSRTKYSKTKLDVDFEKYIKFLDLFRNKKG